jgi:hypothetical protein
VIVFRHIVGIYARRETSTNIDATAGVHQYREDGLTVPHYTSRTTNIPARLAA